MYCSNCGSAIPYGQTICPNCRHSSKPFGANENATYYNPPHTYNNYNQQSNNFTYTDNTSTYEKQCESSISTSNVLGIISIIVGVLISRIAGIVLGIIGLSNLKSVPDWPQFRKRKMDAKKLNKIGIIIPFIIIALVLTAIIVLFIMGYSLSNL